MSTLFSCSGFSPFLLLSPLQLHHRNNVFLHLLEGKKEQVVDLLSRIEHDKRHEDVKVLWSVERSTKGCFERMGFHVLADEEVPGRLSHLFSDCADFSECRSYSEELWSFALSFSRQFVMATSDDAFELFEGNILGQSASVEKFLQRLLPFVPRRAVDMLEKHCSHISVSLAASSKRATLPLPMTESFAGAYLILDVSGFTKLTELLSRHEDGAELMRDSLNEYFTQLLAPILSRSGDVCGFAGDAVMAVFPSDSHCPGSEIVRASQAALEASRVALQPSSLWAHDVAKASLDKVGRSGNLIFFWGLIV